MLIFDVNTGTEPKRSQLMAVIKRNFRKEIRRTPKRHDGFVSFFTRWSGRIGPRYRALRDQGIRFTSRLGCPGFVLKNTDPIRRLPTRIWRYCKPSTNKGLRHICQALPRGGEHADRNSLHSKNLERNSIIAITSDVNFSPEIALLTEVLDEFRRLYVRRCWPIYLTPIYLTPIEPSF